MWIWSDLKDEYGWLCSDRWTTKLEWQTQKDKKHEMAKSWSSYALVLVCESQYWKHWFLISNTSYSLTLSVHHGNIMKTSKRIILRFCCFSLDTFRTWGSWGKFLKRELFMSLLQLLLQIYNDSVHTGTSW